jgi:predicted nuclease of predicted toxin-antitoxin system
MDVHIPRSITVGLRSRGVDVLTAQEDGADTLSDQELLSRATELKRVLFTFDDDLLAEAVERQRSNRPFSGVIFAHPMNISVGRIIHDLQIIAEIGDLEDMQNRTEFLPL